jgi:hypothetical protein
MTKFRLFFSINFSYEIILQKRIDLLKRFEEHMKHSNDIRSKLQQINDDLQQKHQLKIQDIDLYKTQLERYLTDLRTIQSESSVLDRLMEESNTIITDSTTNRTIFFTVESRSIQNLVDMIENKVSSIASLRLTIAKLSKSSNHYLHLIEG